MTSSNSFSSNLTNSHSNIPSQSVGFRTQTTSPSASSTISVPTAPGAQHQLMEGAEVFLSSSVSPNANVNPQAFSVFANVNIPERNSSSFKWPNSHHNTLMHLTNSVHLIDGHQLSSGPAALLLNPSEPAEGTATPLGSAPAPVLPKKPNSFTPTTTQMDFGALPTFSTSLSSSDHFSLPDVVDVTATMPAPQVNSRHSTHHHHHTHAHAHHYHHQFSSNSINDNGCEQNLSSPSGGVMRSVVISPRREHHSVTSNNVNSNMNMNSSTSNLSPFQGSSASISSMITTSIATPPLLPTPLITTTSSTNSHRNPTASGNHFR